MRYLFTIGFWKWRVIFLSYEKDTDTLTLYSVMVCE